MFVHLKKILIVDDSDDLRALLCNWISFRGLTPITASNGRAAIQLLEKQRMDFIITDFHMPEMDGLDLLAWCRTHGLHMPVVFTSAAREPVARETIALGDCCATRLSKPINFKILAAALEAAEHHEHHRDCLHQPFHAAVQEQLRLADLPD